MTAPLPDAVVLLGVKGGPSVLPNGSMPTSSLVQIAGRSVVLDCGLGVTRGLTLQGMRLQDLRTIVITHLHSDHYIELGPLIHTAWTCGLREPIRVYGPSGLLAYWHHFLQSMRFDIELRQLDEGRPRLERLVELHVIEPGLVWHEDGVRVRAVRNVHPPLEESYAIAFESANRRVVFSADTAPFPGLVDFAANADLLVHEVMLAEGVERILQRTGLGEELRHHLMTSHTLAEDTGRIAQAAHVKALALHHFVPGDDPKFSPADWERAVRRHYDGPLFIGRDGMRIALDGIDEARP